MLWFVAGLAVVAVGVVVFLLSPYSWMTIYPHRLLADVFVKNPPFLPADRVFPLSKVLEQRWTDLAREFDEVRAATGEFPEFYQIDPMQTKLSKFGGRKWTTFLVLAYGNWVSENARRCPLLTELIRSDRSVVTAMYSVLAPRKVIPPHYGPFKGVLRYHLCLRAPKSGECSIKVGEENYAWREGEGVVFDDTYLHSVANDSDEERVVVFIDVKRTDAPAWIAWGDSLILWVLRHSTRVKAAVARARQGRVPVPA
jgi:beta-hydroxylase